VDVLRKKRRLTAKPPGTPRKRRSERKKEVKVRGVGRSGCGLTSLLLLPYLPLSLSCLGVLGGLAVQLL
jgi:hypothetical protein